MNDDELRQAMATLDFFRNQLDALTRQSQFLQLSLEETVKAHETIKAFASAKKGDEVLVPCGASSFVRAIVTDNPNVVVGIGTKLSVDMKMDDAIEYMSKGSKEITDALKNLTDTIEEMSSKAQALSIAIQNEYQARQKQQQNKQ